VTELLSNPLVAGLLGLLAGLMLSAVVWRRSLRGTAGSLPANPQLMLESLGDAVIATDLQGRVIYLNPLAEQLTGVDRSLALGQPLETVFPARDIEQPVESLHPDVDYRFRELQMAPGHRIQIGESRAVLRDARGRRIGWVHVLRDESEDHALRQALRESESRFQDFAETAADLYWEMDEQLRFTRVSGKVRFLMGHDPEFVLGKTREELYAGQPVERTPEFEEHLRLIRERKPFSDFVASWRWDDGSIRYVNVSGKPLFDEEGRFVGYRGVSRDITEQKQAEERILHQALYDALTDLPNRGLAMDRLEQDIRQAERSGKRVAVLFLDLDDFKKINDSLGHDTGDRLLVEAASRIGGSLRRGDTVGRLGGDEFIVLLPELKSPDEAGSVAEKLLQSLSRPFHVMGRDLQISASIGIALCPEDGANAAELLRKADAAMYQAKADGRNIFACFTEEMNRKVERRLAIEECMLGALKREEFQVLYQPKLALDTGELVGVEALLRWHSPELGEIPPAEFIPLAENNGQILAIGEFVLHRALDFVADWRERFGGSLSVAVNLSPRQFRQAGLVGMVGQALQQRSLPGDALELEITEGVLLSGHDPVREQLRQLSNLGIELAMDDFGTGYSSLSYLREYPFDVLKIDRSFIGGIAGDAADRTLVEAIVAMAQRLELKVVAEGVEEESQRMILRELGCDQAQGWLFGKAMPPVDLMQRFVRQSSA